MEPIGLTLKDIKTNPFTNKTSGELMIVHLCLNCGKISCNRIAGDDSPEAIIQLLENTDISKVNLNINLLSKKDRSLVLTAIYGYGYEKYLK